MVAFIKSDKFTPMIISSTGEDIFLKYFSDENLYKGHVESYDVDW